MLRYIGRRLLQMIPVFFGATLLIYALVFLMPGDPVQALGGDRGLSEAARARIEAEYNLDKPFLVQYLLYLKGIFTLDFGTTFSGQPAAVQQQAIVDANKEGAAVLGFTSAVAAYGAFFIPKSYGTSIAMTGGPDAALWCFIAFSVSCIAITWWCYARKNADMPC